MKHSLAYVMAFCAGCTFNVRGMDLGTGGNGGDMNGGAVDGGDMAGGGGDMGPVCVPQSTQCAGSMLQTCAADGSGYSSIDCPLGCSTGGATPHCQQLYPTAPVMPSDLDDADLTAPAAITATRLVFDVATGKITDPANPGAPYRDANASSGASAREVKNGIAFRRVETGISIWTFKGLTIPAGTTVVFTSSVPSVNFAAALLSSQDLTVHGAIDARGYGNAMTDTMPCSTNAGGPGGGVGGTAGTPAGAGGGGAGGAAKTGPAGGGGGGYGAMGAPGGGDKNGNNAGDPGAVGGTAELAPLRGGAGGGAGGDGNGGGGGGAVQLVAAGALIVDGQMNAGGCGGFPGLVAKKGGGGGGSGGAFLLEALTIHLTDTAVVAANGGGGGGGGDPGAGQGAAGTSGLGVALGGIPGNGVPGGSGGATSAPTAAQPGTSSDGAGGGGGGVGRIRLNTQSGTATIDGNAKVGPAIGAQASVGTIQIH